MAVLFQRAVRVSLGSLAIEDLRVSFKVKHNATQSPNECELTVYNLGPASRGGLKSKGTRLVLEAGYSGTLAQIFRGETTYIDHKHEGPLWLSKVQCADGAAALATPVRGSFKRGTPLHVVFDHIAEATGLDVTGAAQLVRSTLTEQFTKGYTAHGPATVELDKLLKGRGFTWSVQSGRLQLLQAGQATREGAVLLSPDTGLVGSPAHGSPDKIKQTPARLTAKSLLQPGLRPGRKVRLEAAEVTGNFVCVAVEHEGDTAGGAWWSTVELEPVNG